MKKKFALSCILFFFILGCSTGNHSINKKSLISKIDGEPVIPNNANSIFISLFFNRTSEQAIEQQLSLKIKKDIAMDGRLLINENRIESNLILRGIIDKFMIMPLSFNDFGNVQKKIMKISVSIILYNNMNKKIIFIIHKIIAFKNFSDTTVPIENKEQVKEKVLDELAKRITSQILKGWYSELLTNQEKGIK